MLPMITAEEENGCRSEESECCKPDHENAVKILKLENNVNELSSKLNYISKLIEDNKKSLNKNIKQMSRDIDSFQLAIYHEFDLHILRIKESCDCGFNVLKENDILCWIHRLKSSTDKVEVLRKDVLQVKNSPNDEALSIIEKQVEKESLELSVLIDMLQNSHEQRMQLTPNYEFILQNISSAMRKLAIHTKKFVNGKGNHRHADINYKVYDSVHINLQEEKTNELRGCTILPSGKLVFSDYGNKRLLLFLRKDTNIKLERVIPLKGNPFCITATGGEKIAITFQDLKCLHILDLNSNSVCLELSFCAPCTGISYCKDKLAVRVEGEGFFIIDPNSGKTTQKILVDGNHIPCVSLYDNRVYYANWKTGKVSCCEIGGRQLWEFKNVILQSPNGIATDSFGNVFISGYSSNNVLIISRDGLSAKQISPTDGSLHLPLGIHYNTTRDEILVTSAAGYAVLYSVTNLI
ncbi:unnamed protein product [Mytilus coruscus]|uniref:RING-type E3 ubiquitin transferase n=1 Tax=Mytilus coruscus TaxID=42192 RepID=A0A6J8EMI7_MYTCO|nr:unnamed protein product [Mytilus coruscus]